MKVQNPIIGRARGSAGGMTFCKNYDKNVARAKAFEVSNPNTQAQQTQRNFFKQLTALCADFSEDQLRFLFPSKPKTMSRRNALSKQIAESSRVIGNNKIVDYVEIDTLGNAPVMDISVTKCDFHNEEIRVLLGDSVKTNQSIADYDFVVAIVNETKNAISLTTENSMVSDGRLNVAIPSGWETTDSIHAIPLITDSKGGKIALVGFGSMSVTRRPPHKND